MMSDKQGKKFYNIDPRLREKKVKYMLIINPEVFDCKCSLKIKPQGPIL
jgi:hypothetical protein